MRSELKSVSRRLTAVYKKVLMPTLTALGDGRRALCTSWRHNEEPLEVLLYACTEALEILNKHDRITWDSAVCSLGEWEDQWESGLSAIPVTVSEMMEDSVIRVEWYKKLLHGFSDILYHSSKSYILLPETD